MWRISVAVAVVILGSQMIGTALQSQSAGKIEYDTFCKLGNVEAKRSAFVATTPENRAELVRTHLERWRDANKARLNEKQLALMSDLIALATPAAYGGGETSPEARARRVDLQLRQRQLFTADDVQAMQPNGPCVPK